MVNKGSCLCCIAIYHRKTSLASETRVSKACGENFCQKDQVINLFHSNIHLISPESSSDKSQ